MFNFWGHCLTSYQSLNSLHDTERFLWDQLTRLGGTRQQTLHLIPLRLSRCCPTIEWPQGLDSGCQVHRATPSGIQTCDMAWGASLQFDLTPKLDQWFCRLWCFIPLVWCFSKGISSLNLSLYHPLNSGHLILVGLSDPWSQAPSLK